MSNLGTKECVLQGSILPSALEEFLARCEALIGFLRTPLRYDEYVYTFPNGATISNSSVPFRARNHNPEATDSSWRLCYVGPTEIKIPIRSVIHMEHTPDDPRLWLTDIGHIFDYGYSVQGYCFALKGVNLSIYRAYKMPEIPGNPSCAPDLLLNESYLDFIENGEPSKSLQTNASKKSPKEN
eukprot:CFRG3496T1